METQGHGSYSSILVQFSFFPCMLWYCMLTLQFYVSGFSGSVEAKTFKLGIHTDNELYCRIENRTHCSYFPLYLSIFLSFKAKYVSQFSQELFKLESPNMEYLCRMSDCIVGLRLRLITLSLLFLSIFLCLRFHMLKLKICVGAFSENI